MDADDRAVVVITCLMTIAALGLSYRALYDFATQVGGLPQWGAVFYPALIDFLMVVGELRLFSATHRNEHWRIKAWAWLLTAAGLCASVAGNIAHVGWHAPAGQVLAAATAPLVAAASLCTGLGIVKLRARAAARTKRDAAAGDRDGSTRSGDRPAAVRSRARLAGQGTAGVKDAAAEVAQALAAGREPPGKRKLAGTHGISEHRARSVLEQARASHVAGSNGSLTAQRS